MKNAHNIESRGAAVMVHAPIGRGIAVELFGAEPEKYPFGEYRFLEKKEFSIWTLTWRRWGEGARTDVTLFKEVTLTKDGDRTIWKIGGPEASYDITNKENPFAFPGEPVKGNLLSLLLYLKNRNSGIYREDPGQTSRAMIGFFRSVWWAAVDAGYLEEAVYRLASDEFMTKVARKKGFTSVTDMRGKVTEEALNDSLLDGMSEIAHTIPGDDGRVLLPVWALCPNSAIKSPKVSLGVLMPKERFLGWTEVARRNLTGSHGPLAWELDEYPQDQAWYFVEKAAKAEE